MHGDVCGSDHFPIILEHLSSNSLKSECQCRNLTMLDSLAFEMFCETDTSPDIPRCSSPILVLQFTETLSYLRQIESIPKTSTNPKSKSKPWYDGDCREAIKQRKRAERQFNKCPISDNSNELRLNRAKARCVVKSEIRSCWRNFVSGITPETPMHKAWNMVGET